MFCWKMRVIRDEAVLLEARSRSDKSGVREVVSINVLGVLPSATIVGTTLMCHKNVLVGTFCVGATFLQ